MQETRFDSQTVAIGEYSVYSPDTERIEHMILDSQALEHLELLRSDISSTNPLEGTLLDFLNHTKTYSGKARLESWIKSPLLRISKINSRLDSVEDLIKFPNEANVMRKKLQDLPNLECMLNKTFKHSIRS